MAGRGAERGPNRRVRVSKAMSWLLRHGAHKEGIPIDQQGYVNVADMLKWHKMNKELNVTFAEVLEEVRDNEKQRFALLYTPPEPVLSKPAVAEAVSTDSRTGEESVDLNPLNLGPTDSIQTFSEEETTAADAPTAQATSIAASVTARALASAQNDLNPNPSHYLIRATQGHSIKTVSASAYLTPISLTTPSSIPQTVVHGTFYAAWPAILRTGGLKPMSRVHVHFATAPNLSTILDASAATKEAEPTEKAMKAVAGAKEEEEEKRGEGNQGEEHRAVISGMRNDAQILIYINLRKALEMGVPFWMSENGVVLSEGVEILAKGKTKSVNVVPVTCWDVVVEAKEGLGVLWRNGIVVRDLPEHLMRMGWPHRKEGKGSGDGGRGRKATDKEKGELGGMIVEGKERRKGRAGAGGGKPKLRVEREGVDLA
jgi:RNA:NAD 2'-phosphotransferase (TPT1/KptA family)